MSAVREKVNIFKKLSRKRLNYQKQKLAECPDEMICDLVAVIQEVCRNRGLKLTKKELKKIRKFRKFMRGVSLTKSNKRKYILKNIKGGFLAALAPLLASLASAAIPVISKLIG